MISLLHLPVELIHIITTHQLKSISSSPLEYQSHLSNLSQTCKSLNSYINSQHLYKNIIIYDNDNSSIVNNKQNYTFVHIDQFPFFINSLTFQNFIHIKSIHVYCKSNFQSFDYSRLYYKFNHFWKFTNHPIEFINFDVENIRKFQSINQYLLNNNHHDVLDENDETIYSETNMSISNNKLNNLRNWSILNIQEFFDLPNNNQNLNVLDFFIETFRNDYIPYNHQLQFENLKILNLNTTLSTKLFQKLTIELPKLDKLSITYSHSFTDKTPLRLSDLNLNLNQLGEIQLKLNCLHPDCQCINQIYNELIVISQQSNELTKLSIINLNSKNSTNNITQYKWLLEHQLQPIMENFTNLKHLFININEYSRMDVDLEKFFNIVNSKHLESLIVVDYFNWLPPNYRNFINECKCSDCVYSRDLFNQMSIYDSNNNFTHDFKKFNYDPNLKSNSVLLNKNNLKFITFLIGLYKHQFENVIIYPNLKEFNLNDKFGQFKQLFKHNFINEKVIGDISKANLGGINV